MNKELAKTLTTALVQFIDKNQPNDKMDVSSIEAEKLERCFTEEKFNMIEDLYAHRMKPELTEFEKRVRFIMDEVSAGRYSADNIDDVRGIAKGLLELAKKQFLSYADESNPKIEAMADLERTFECNPDKLLGWLKNELDRIRLEAHTKGYNKGYKDAEKQYNESVAYHFPTMPTPPSGWGCDGTYCTNPHMDCINCPRKTTGGTITTPNIASGTSTATLHGNTSATDGKEHNPSFID